MLAEKLEALHGKVTDENLHSEGRYFDEGFYDLTQCGHGDTGNFSNRHDGELISLLWNAFRAGELVLASNT